MAHERRRDGSRDLEVRPPKQQRSREAWNRVLDAGVAILEDGGYDAFTIAAVCERASVAPTAIYARTTSKDALFLAVYEHGIAEHAGRAGGLRGRRPVGGPVTRPSWSGRRWRRWSASRSATSGSSASVVLISAAHEEVARRGSRYAERARRRLHAAWCCGARDAIRTPTRRRPSAPASARSSRRRSSASPTARPSRRRPRSTTTRSSRTSARPRCATCWPRAIDQGRVPNDGRPTSSGSTR